MMSPPPPRGRELLVTRHREGSRRALYGLPPLYWGGRQAFVHGHALAEKVHRADTDPVALAELVAEHDIQWAITRSREGESFGVTLARSGAFAMVFFDDVAAVYAKKDGPNAARARPLGISRLHAFDAARGPAARRAGRTANRGMVS